MLDTYNELTEIFEKILLENLKYNNKIEEFKKIKNNIIVPSSKDEFGDYQSNVCLNLAKIYNKKPRDLASELIELIKQKKEINDLCQNLEIAGPGFINITLKKTLLIKKLISNTKCKRVGVPLAFEKDNINSNKKIIIDFSSPNIAKEMHVGHLRSTIIGDSLSRIFELRGYEVKRINHIGDWGTQFGMLISQLKDKYSSDLNNYNDINLGDLVSFYKEAKKRFDNDIDFQERARAEVIKLQKGDKESIYAWNLLCDKSRKEFNNIYQILNIEIEERGESFYNPFLKEIIDELEKKKILVKDQGAKCVFLDGMTNKEGKSLPLIVQKKDGGYNYATTDLAAIKYRFKKKPNGDGAKRIIYVTDHGQANHFKAVFQVARKAKWIPEGCLVDHVPFGLVQGIDGKKIKTREGKTVKLKELLSEAIKRAKEDLEARLIKESRVETNDFKEQVSKVIGISSVKYADLSQNRITNYQFSFNKMLALNGNTAPYLLYTLVRIAGINRKNNLKDIPINSDNIDFQEDIEWKIIKKLLKFDEIIVSAEKDLMPNKICSYVFELCQIFNRFYDQLTILKAENNKKCSRLAICNLTEKTLHLSLKLLGIETLERM